MEDFMKHQFKFSEKIGERKIYLIKCKHTEGEFSTRMWELGKETQNKCPCCGEEI